MDSGNPGRFGGDPFFSRDANVGLSGGFGTVTLGRGLAPNFLPTIILNPFGDSFTFSPLVLHANVPLFNGTGWTATTPSDTGWANEIIYSTPQWGGLSGRSDKLAPGGVRRTTTTLGYDYPLSKSTDVHAMAMHDSITGTSSGNSYGAGIRKRF